MKHFDLTKEEISQVELLKELMADAWFYGTITVPETGGYDE